MVVTAFVRVAVVIVVGALEWCGGCGGVGGGGGGGGDGGGGNWPKHKLSGHVQLDGFYLVVKIAQEKFPTNEATLSIFYSNHFRHPEAAPFS